MRAPRFQLLYRGIDISSDVAPELISCTYTDKVHGEADEIEITVKDETGKWRGAWCPEHGDKVKLWVGYEDGPLVYAGEFEIDEPNAKISRGGDTLSFRGVSAPVKKALRTKKTKGYEKKSLKKIVGEVAAEHGFTVTGEVPDVTFERQTQRRERDLEYLSRLADEYGAYFTVKGNQLVFMKREKLHERTPVRVLSAADVITADLKRAAHKTYSKAKATYFDGNEKKKIEVEVEDKKVTTGDTLRIDDRVENTGQAKKRAKSALQKANMKQWTGNIQMEGDPLLLAGQTLALGPDYGKWARKYLVKQSRHHLTRSGYTLNIELEGVE